MATAGLTPTALSREIVLRLRDFTRETTQVTVSVQQFNSRAVFLRLLDISRSLSDRKIDTLIKARDYEGLEMMVLKALMG